MSKSAPPPTTTDQQQPSPAPVPPGGRAALPEGSLPKPFLGPQGDENRDPPPGSPAPVSPAPTVKDTR